MEKSPDAFRTISEVADLLETPAHVLRFWESRFPQIRPVKRAGGRRYYRPADVALLTGIKRLLHDEGMTIRGVQKILREQGVRHVSGMVDEVPAADEDGALKTALAEAGQGDDSPAADAVPPLPPAEVETAQVIALQAALTGPATKTGDLFTTAPEPPPKPPSEAPAESAPEPPPEMPAETPSEFPAEPEPPEFPSFPPPEEAPMPEDMATPASGDDMAEAPMALWAEPEDDAEENAGVLPGLRVTRIGQRGEAPPPAPAVPDHIASPPLPAEPAASAPDNLAPTSTLAARLRRVSPAALSSGDRAAFSVLRARARSLRDRMSLPPRAGF